MILLRNLKEHVCACLNLHKLQFRRINTSSMEVLELQNEFLRLVPKMRARRRAAVFSDLSSQLTNKFLSKVIAGDET